MATLNPVTVCSIQNIRSYLAHLVATCISACIILMPSCMPTISRKTTQNLKACKDEEVESLFGDVNLISLLVSGKCFSCVLSLTQLSYTTPYFLPFQCVEWWNKCTKLSSIAVYFENVLFTYGQESKSIDPEMANNFYFMFTLGTLEQLCFALKVTHACIHL